MDRPSDTPLATPDALAYVHDARHRFSYELRPDRELDGRLRAIATALEDVGLILAGASTAPRFQPHLTLGRASVASFDAVRAVADVLAGDTPAVSFDRAGEFGDGRIAYLLPVARAELGVRAAREAVVDRLDRSDVDPLVFTRDWTPHVTVAYAIPEPARPAAHELVRAALPLAGRWASVQVWDLDVRPTHLVHRVQLDHGG